MKRGKVIMKVWEERSICMMTGKNNQYFGPLPKEFYDPCDYFGGDIEIISKLDDLKRLGISCIYLNQIIRKSIHSLEITKILSGYASLPKNAGFM